MHRPATCLLLVIAAILGIGSSSVQARAPRSARQTPQLIVSTYLGGSKACFPGGYPLTFAQNAACDAQGNTYVSATSIR